jgi:PEP-CTERM/exosortase A-associated glycosyltransferase
MRPLEQGAHCQDGGGVSETRDTRVDKRAGGMFPSRAGTSTRLPRGTVLHVFDHSFPINDGYAFRSGEIVRFTRRAGWRTVHVTSVKQGLIEEPREVVDGLEFYRTQLPRNSLDPWVFFNQWAGVRALRHRLEYLVRHEKPALLHVHSPCLNGLAALPVARRFHTPVIYEVRALWEDGAVDSAVCRQGDLRYRVSRMLETYVFRKVEHIVTICEGLRAEITSRSLDPESITVVPNSVDFKRFHHTAPRDVAEAERLDLTPGKTFGFIGTFFPYEGLDVLMRAVPVIRAREPRARFVIVGDGPDAAKIRALARDLAIEDAVVSVGRVRQADVERYYDLIDVAVYPRLSTRVTELVTPLKPLEAMAKGKVLVASDVGGHREMVFPGRNGILFRAGDPISLADACLGLLSRPGDWDTIRDNGRRYVREVRNWERTVAIYDELYSRLLAKSSISRKRA